MTEPIAHSQGRVRRGLGLIVAALLVGVAWAGSTARAIAPEPSPITRQWELDLEVGPLRVVELTLPGVGRRSYYYATFTVTNDSGRDLFLAPMWELGTDQGEVMLSGKGVPDAVTAELLRRLRNPFLEDQISILGTIRQGEENARDGLVVWPVGKETVKEVSIYAIGFSGETKTITVRDAATGVRKPVVLRKTLMCRHTIRGNLLDERTRTEGGTVLKRTTTRWILRKAETTVGADPQHAKTGNRHSGQPQATDHHED